MTNQLPAAFADLEPFCAKWLRPTEAQRNEVRIDSGMQEIRAFYDVVFPQFDAIIQHLNRFPLGDLPPAEQNLLGLMFAFVEASTPVERFNSPIVTKTFPPERFLIHEDLGRSGGW
jgi:hypothetical protein